MRSGSFLAKKQQSVRPYDSITLGVCGHCPAGCGLKAFMAGDEAVDFWGDEEHPANKGSLCPKALNLYQVHDDPRRLAAPCVRDSPGAAWREVAWEQALDELARRLSALAADSSRPATVALPSFPHDPLDYRVGAAWCAHNLAGALGPGRFVPAALGTGGALAAMFGVPAAGLAMNTQRDWAMSRVILLVGGDLAAEAPVSFGPLEDARDRGTRLLYLGSCGGMTALRASEAMIVRPGTEALALGAIVHVLLREDWYDAAFLGEWADGLETLQNRVAACRPEEVAEACGVPAAQLEGFAQAIGQQSPIQVQAGGLEAMPFLDDALLSLCGAIVALRGQLGIPGGGLNLHGVSPFRLNRCLFSGEELAPRRLDELLLSGACGAIAGHGNWAAGLPGGEATRAALAACGLVVHLGAFDDETRALAHISLPVAHWSEYAALSDQSDTRALQWRGALLRPLGQARTPLDIWTGLVSRLAPAAAPPWEGAPGDTPQRRLAAWLLKSDPLTAGIEPDALDAVSGGILWPCTEAGEAVFERTRFIRGNVRGRNILFLRGSGWPGHGGRFPTRDGRVHLDAVVAPGPPPVPPAELALVLNPQVMRAANHPAAVLRKGLPLAGFHPATAMRWNLRRGQTVRISSAAGTKAAVVRITWSAPKDTVVLEPETGAALLPAGGAGTVALEVAKAAD